MKLSMLLWLTTLMPQPVADQACLATTVYLEARSESTNGQLAVAEVALRRRDRGRWGDTVCKVVTMGMRNSRSSANTWLPAGPPKIPNSCSTHTTSTPVMFRKSAARKYDGRSCSAISKRTSAG